MPEIVTPAANAAFLDHLSDPYADGWHFGAGDAEFWKYSHMLLTPGGRALDIGIGLGRSSLYFALHGMQVTGYDTRAENVAGVNEMAADVSRSIPCDMKAIVGDIREAAIEKDTYDLAIMDEMHHQPSTQAMFELMDKGIDSLKPGGSFYLRIIGRLASAYQDLVDSSHYERAIRVVADGVVEHPCGCSGELKIEPTIFMDPTEVIHHIMRKGTSILYQRTLPQRGQWNILFGEDFNDTIPAPEEGGMITVIAKKLAPFDSQS